MKKLFIVIILVLLIGIAYLALRSDVTPNNLIGGETDSHGCLGSAGYQWCQATQSCLRTFEEFCSDAVQSLTVAIETNVGVKLSRIGEKTLNWRVSSGTDKILLNIPAVSYGASDLTNAHVTAINQYLGTVGQISIDNVAGGVSAGLKGYYYHYMACTFNFQHNNLVENSFGIMEPEGDSFTTELTCGFFNPNIKITN